ncbi:MAG: xanthine dehydrogenase family protein molybdopterin-binding subunit [Ignavibacteriae bacterium]|nr:xanthine dehydrogenase family protein molybdopterin-binding subunit [Ignavibacteriota bacterium]
MAIKKSKHFFEDELIETIGEVSEEIYEQLPNNKDLNYIGKKISRYDGYEKVSGKAKYTFDIKLPNMAYAKILRSDLPNAKIKSIDISIAKNLKGVLEILTYQNIDDIDFYGENGKLLDQHVKHEGDEVACIVAESEKIAETASKLIQVQYEKLGFSTSIEQSTRDNSVKIYDWGNIRNGKPDEYERGNVEEGFLQSDFIVEDTFTTEVVIHHPTEVHCSVVNWEGDKLIIYDSTQGIFEIKKSVSEYLKISEDKVQVIKKYMGGGFGSKLEAGKYTVLAAILSKKINRPVRLAVDRKEMSLATGNRPDSIQHLKVGVKKDGTLMAMTHEAKAAVGAYPTGGGCSWPFKQIYLCPNVKTIDFSVITNTGKARPFRAPGHVQGTFGLDSIIDDAAYKIGMDPLEFRLKNYAEKDQVWGAEYTSKLLREAYKEGAEKINWERRNKVPGSGNGFKKRGIGMATQIWWGGGGPPAHANIEIKNDGSVIVYSGTQDIGTGTYTIISQVAAEILEIPIQKIEVILGDTDKTPYGPSSGGSTTAPSISPAVRDAAEKMKRKLISASAAILNVDEKELFYSLGSVSDKSKTNKLSFTEIAANLKGQKLFAEGSREENLKGYVAQTFGAQFAEVEVDTLTGFVKVLKIVAAHDIGRTLNRQTLENQFHGGIIQGLGMALMEERIMDSDFGKMLNTNLHDYKIPTMLDIPEIEVIIVSEADVKANNMGVKGIGEPAIIPTPGAISNAVYNAIGVRVKSLPITPNKILKALNS